MLFRLTALALAGALGTLCRYALHTVAETTTSRFPTGTFAVNMVGCLLFGAVWAVAEARDLIHPELRLVMLTGFMGAFTTFSTFVFETHELARSSDWALLALNVGGQVVFGLLLFGAGVWVGRAV